MKSAIELISEERKWKEWWPWEDKDGRQKADVKTSLIKAGALILAEIDRLQSEGE